MIDEFNSVSMIMSTQNDMCIEWSTLIKDENCFQSTKVTKEVFSTFSLSSRMGKFPAQIEFPFSSFIG